MKSEPNQFTKDLLVDLFIILASITLAILLAKTHLLVNILTSSQEAEHIGSFIAGMFFTSAFTIAPATVALGEIASANSVLITALLGALGAVCGDLLIFVFIRDRFSKHLIEIVKKNGHARKILSLQWARMRWFHFFVGGLILASPLPDELGVGVLGFSKLNFYSFIALTFVFKFIGIYLIGSLW